MVQFTILAQVNFGNQVSCTLQRERSKRIIDEVLIACKLQICISFVQYTTLVQPFVSITFANALFVFEMFTVRGTYKTFIG